MNTIEISARVMWEMIKATKSVATEINKWDCHKTQSYSVEFTAGELHFAITEDIFVAIASVSGDYGDFYITLEPIFEENIRFITETEYFAIYDELMPEGYTRKVGA